MILSLNTNFYTTYERENSLENFFALKLVNSPPPNNYYIEMVKVLEQITDKNR